MCGILLAAFLAGCCAPRNGTRAVLEYRVEWLRAGEMQEELNKLGKDGWVLVTAYTMPESSLREVTLSRPKR
jgi:hypothetical protein